MGCGKESFRTVDELAPNLYDLDELGRLHFFYHSPRSKLPVRDILNDQGQGYKTEPHIETKSENYCQECIQQNIRAFLRSPQKYLFLYTKCRGEKSNHSGKLYVVGYIVKQRCELRHGRFYAVSGETKLYSFDDAYPLKSDGNPRHVKKICDRIKTGRILDHFEGRRNILNQCVAEVQKLKRLLPRMERRRQFRQCK